MTALRILAIDGSGLFSMHWEIGQGKEYGQAQQGTLAAVQRAREGFDRVVFCCDSGKSFRRSLIPEYKANRTDRGEPYRAQLRSTAEALAKDRCAIIYAPEYGSGYAEADDVLGTIAEMAHGEHQLVILTQDKDLSQLVTEDGGVTIMKPNGEIVDYAAVREKMGVPPPRVTLLLALAGDASDNYKPYKGLGPKGAQALIEAYATESFQGINDIWENLHDAGKLLKDGPLVERMIAAGKEPALNALDVATIRRDIPIDFAQILAEPTAQELSYGDGPQETPAASPVVTNELIRHDPTLAQVAKRPAVAMSARVQSQLPYWAQDGYLARLHEIGRCFVTARCFPNVATPEQAMVVGMFAHECRVGIATAMQHAYFVHGRLGWSATWFLMRIEASGQREKFDIQEITDAKCVILVKRKGSPERRVTWLWTEAERAGLTKPSRSGEPSNWQKYPQDMNLARCIARASRQEFRAICGGMYLIEEMVAELPEEAGARHVADTRQLLTATGYQQAA